MEKHNPVITVNENIVTVVIGEILHPMTEEHLIQWIEIEVEGMIHKVERMAGDEPKAVFELDVFPTKVIATEHCNIHGTWTSTWEK